ncbi:hypothetical protein JOF53_001260 [Crossiella equi]|uniref:Trypsin-co-occurring domain-containing protein n=1 Tax=Crossiella equi TaxID=130796 RepID=A0ABS5A721_9PSEU|nr:CU044_2847 family protein [Crossiella equi]MBP2472388.1 hypothetical protein [Crossiella equi]
MRREIVPISVGDRTVYAEVSVPAGGDVSTVDLLGNAVALQEQIAAIAGWVATAVHTSLPRKPDRVGVDFGVKLGVKSGKLFSVLAEASGEASLTVRLEWDNSRADVADE